MAQSFIVPEQARQKLAYTLAEAAQAAGVSRPVLSNWVHIPGFPAFRSGKRWVIPVGAFERWLEEQAAKGANITG